MSWNETTKFNNTSSSFINIFQYIKQEILIYWPIISISFGTIGFIGNVFTFLQPKLRYNTCCIYLLCGSIIDIINLFTNLLSNYIHATTGSILASITNRYWCKARLFFLVFLPQLSMNLLTLSLIDRYACTCSLTSSIRYIRRLHMAPWMITITIIISGISSFYGPVFHDIVPGFGCVSVHPLINGVLYIIIHGFITPIMMLIFVLLTYKNVKESRRRAGLQSLANIDRSHNPFVRMIFTQVLVTSLLSLQWISFYIYHIINFYSIKTNEQRSIHYFIWSISNNIYYLINGKSFYLSTLTSRLFRQTFFKALSRLLSNCQQQHRNIKLPRSSSNISSRNRVNSKSQSEF